MKRGTLRDHLQQSQHEEISEASEELTGQPEEKSRRLIPSYEALLDNRRIVNSRVDLRNFQMLCSSLWQEW